MIGVCVDGVLLRPSVSTCRDSTPYSARFSTHLKVLWLTVSDVQTVTELARLARELSPIHRNRRKIQGAIGIHDPLPMLPLHHPARARRIGGVGDGAVVGFFVIPVGGEGVGDAGVVGLDQFVCYWVEEALFEVQLVCILWQSMIVRCVYARVL